MPALSNSAASSGTTMKFCWTMAALTLDRGGAALAKTSAKASGLGLRDTEEPESNAALTTAGPIHTCERERLLLRFLAAAATSAWRWGGGGRSARCLGVRGRP